MVDAIYCKISKPFHNLPYKIEETARKKEFNVCTTKKKIA